MDFLNSISASDVYWYGTRSDDVLSYSNYIEFKGAISFSKTCSLCDYIPGLSELSYEGINSVRKDWNGINIEDLLLEGFGRNILDKLFKTEEMKTVICYYPSHFMHRLSYFPQISNKIRILSNDFIVKNALYDKFYVRRCLSSIGLEVVPFIIHDMLYLTFSEAKSFFRNTDKLVIQESHGSTGLNTVLVNDQNEWDYWAYNLSPRPVSISPYIYGKSLNVNACVYKDQVWIAYPSLQVIGDPLCTNYEFGFCGNDFSSIKSFVKNNTLEKIFMLSKKVGNWLFSCRYEPVQKLLKKKINKKSKKSTIS